MGCSNQFAKNAKHRATFKQPSITVDGMGGRVTTLATQGTYWAVVEPLSGKEVFTHDGTRSRVSNKLIIRYVSAFADVATTSAYKVEIDGRTYAIKTMRNLAEDLKNMGNAFQEFMLEEGGADVTG